MQKNCVLLVLVFAGACANESATDVVGETTAALYASGAAGAAAPTSGAFCRILLEKTGVDQGDSRVVSRQCYETEDALLQARRSEEAAASNTTLLMTWYTDADFNGVSTYIEGKDGPCDGEGYGIRNVGADWNDRISSFKAWNQCNHVVGYVDANYGGYWVEWPSSGNVSGPGMLDVNWVGAAINDHITSFRLWHN